MTDSEFYRTVSGTKKLIVVDFYADWCKPCVNMSFILSEITKEYNNTVIFSKINIEHNNIDNTLGIEKIPTLLFIKDRKIIYKIEGTVSKQLIINAIEVLR